MILYLLNIFMHDNEAFSLQDVDSCETFSQEISSKVQNLRSRLKQYSETYQKKSTRV